MTRIRFEDLPSTDTPINATQLDKLNNVVISPTEPTTGEEVWIQKGKNLFDTRLLVQSGWNTSDNPKRVIWGMKVKAGVTYTITNYSQKTVSIFETTNLIQSASNNSVLVEHGTLTGAGSKTITTKNDAYLRLQFSNNDDSNISISDILPSYAQVEIGDTSTNFEPFIPKKIYTKNDNDVYEEFYNEENLEVYSTRETRIGTWIDGKSLYRKVITTTIPSGTISTEINIDVPNYRVLTKLDYRLQASGSTNYAFGNFYASSTDFQRCFFRNGTIQVRLGANTSGADMLFVIEYTKTTD